MEEVFKKDKYIIYNGENRILTFLVEGFNKILIPTFMKNSSLYCNETAIKIFECLGLDSSELEYLKSIPYLEERLICHNGKLKKAFVKHEKNYFYCKAEITDDKYTELIETLKLEGVKIEFLSSEEIKSILEENEEMHIDKYLLPILEELNQMLFKEDYKELIKKG